jgi:hypothetical protein
MSDLGDPPHVQVVRRAWSWRLIAAMVAGLAILFFFSARSLLAGGGECRRVSLSQRPEWVMGGAWLQDGRTLAFIDALNQTVVKVAEDGSSLGVVTGPSGELMRSLSPRLLRSQGGNGILVEGDMVGQPGVHLVAFDGELAPRRRLQVSGVAHKSLGITVYGIYDWQPVGRDEIVAFADFARGPRRSDWTSGYLRFSLSKPDDLKVLSQGGVDDPEKLFSRTSYTYIAAIGDTAYILAMGVSTDLYQNAKGSSDLRPLEEFRSQLTPTGLGRFDSWDEFPGLMRRVERSSMPAGLYAWNGSLYLLARSPEGKFTRWTLTRLSPETGRELGTVTLPTRANHLTVVPGPRQWAFLEKGPFRAGRRQAVGTVLLVPASRFQDSSSGELCN